MLLLDVNVWLALTFDSHFHHPPAKTWFDNLANDVCFFCRFTQLGFLRLATNSAIFGKHALTLPKAGQKYDVSLTASRISVADDPASIEAPWRAFTQARSFSPKIWNDAYLAAFSIVGNFEFVTFDKGFSQFPGMICTILH